MQMLDVSRMCVAGAFAIASLIVANEARASFHLWQISEIYSDACGNVQYVELSTTFTGQEFLTNANFGGGLQASEGVSTHAYSFPSDLPATPQYTTQNKRFLVASQGFADLN